MESHCGDFAIATARHVVEELFGTPLQDDVRENLEKRVARILFRAFRVYDRLRPEPPPPSSN